MKKNALYFLSLLAMSMGLWSCSDNDPIIDLEAPIFQEVSSPKAEDAAGVIELRGQYFEVRTATSTHMHITGRLTDNEGLSQLRIDLHGGYDGHSHGRLASALPALRIDKVVELNGAKEVNFDEEIYYDDADYRAGPYHVILHAVDLAGNSTSFADGSSVNRGIYLVRPYMPLVALEGDPTGVVDKLDIAPGSPLSLNGYIEQHRGGKRFDVTFIRVSIVEDHHDDDEHDHDHDDHDDEVLYEAIWGQSAYLTASSGQPLGGAPIPAFSADRLAFATLFAQRPHTVTEAEDHKILRIEVEDTGGNLTIREFEIEAHD